MNVAVSLIIDKTPSLTFERVSSIRLSETLCVIETPRGQEGIIATADISSIQLDHRGAGR